MDLLDRLLEGNARHVTQRDRVPDPIPRLGLTVVACMDTRHVPEHALGLAPGDAQVIRSAGAVVDEGVLRSLAASTVLLQVSRIVVMGHTGCGIWRLHDRRDDVAAALAKRFGRAPSEAERDAYIERLDGFGDAAENVRRGIRRIREDPRLPPGLEVHGLLYDVETGRTHPV